jgi:hypothetical protein
LRDLILQVADAQRVVRRQQAEIEISKSLLGQRLTLTGLKIAREELQGVEAQEALAERIQQRIRDLTTRSPEAKGAVDTLKEIHEIVRNSLERARGAVGAATDPLWLDQDTVLYLPSVSGDSEFSGLRASRERAARQLEQILEHRMAALDGLKSAVEQRNAVFRKALTFLAPEDGKDVGSAWKQTEEWLDRDQHLRQSASSRRLNSSRSSSEDWPHSVRRRAPLGRTGAC